MEALFRAIPAVGSVAMVAGLFFFMFTVLALHLLLGQMSSCQDADGNILDPYYMMPDGSNIDKAWCQDHDEDAVFTVVNTT